MDIPRFDSMFEFGLRDFAKAGLERKGHTV